MPANNYGPPFTVTEIVIQLRIAKCAITLTRQLTAVLMIKDIPTELPDGIVLSNRFFGYESLLEKDMKGSLLGFENNQTITFSVPLNIGNITERRCFRDSSLPLGT